ncbi:hypothetical protein ACFLR7_04500 [Acidobacteriota bacterium]
MIETATSVEFKTYPIATVLQKTLHYSQVLCSAAVSCATNFKWLDLSRMNQIPLLDFDIICGAHPNLALEKRMTNESSEQKSDILNDYSGPLTIRYFLHILGEFAIPPGTTAELLSRKEKISERISARAKTFISRIEDALCLDDPGEILIGQKHRKKKELLLQDLTQFADDVQNQKLLESLLDRATPVAELATGNLDDMSDVEAFRKVYAFLKSKRPHYELNNLHDALNAALVVRIFNLSKSQQYNGKIPVLISQTNVIHQLNAFSMDYLHIDSTPTIPTFFNNGMFLVISEALLANTQGRYKLVVDEAKYLESDAKGIAESCISLIHSCNDIVHNGKPRDSIVIKDLPSYDWEELLFRRTRFEHRWGAMFGPSQMASQLDHEEYLKILLSSEFRHLLKGKKHPEIKKSQERIKDELIANKPVDYELWNHILNSVQKEECSITTYPAFSFFVAQDSNTLLREITPGYPLADFNEAIINENHNIRIAALPSFLSCGAVIVIGSYLNSSHSNSRYISIIWLHKLDCAKILNNCFYIMEDMVQPDTVFQAQIFNPKSKFEIKSPFRNIKADMQKRIEEIEDVECFHIKGDFIRFYADTLPIDGIEMQVGFVFNSNLWNEELADSFYRFISLTSEIPLTPKYVESIFLPITSKLRIVPTINNEINPIYEKE